MGEYSLLTILSIALFATVTLCVALPIIVYFAIRYFSRRRVDSYVSDRISKKDLVCMLVKFPAENQHNEAVMSRFLSSVHRLLPTDTYLGLEITSIGKFLYFYIVTQKPYKDLVKSQLYAQYPDVEIDETTDYWSVKDAHIAVGHLRMKKNSLRPVLTYQNMKEHLLRNISAYMMTINPDEQVYIQIVMRRVGSSLISRGIDQLKYETFGKKYSASGQASASSQKSAGPLYMADIRLGYKSSSTDEAHRKLRMVFAFMKQFKSHGNEIELKNIRSLGHDDNQYSLVQSRSFYEGQLWSTDEISTLYHFPYGAGVSSNAQQRTKKSPAPDIVPRRGELSEKDITYIGETNYRNEKVEFGIKRIDRRRHMYVIGKTGSGKSRLMELLMISDIRAEAGFCLIDPHGDLAEQVLKHIPKSRVKDVVYVNPSDHDFPIAFNPLEYTEDFEKRQHIAFFFISIFKKIFAGDWNERMEHILRFIILALLETQDSNVLGITRILTDTAYRRYVIGEIKDPAVRAFWAHEFSSWNEQYSSQAIVPILNKVGQFVSNPIIRNMVGQRKNSLDFERFMNEGKIVIINLSKGKLGDDNAALLGSMFITKIQQATLARAHVAEESRRDFYFYIDEFQNFATEAFNSILSESRKYRLNLTIAHQYIDQLPDDVKSSVFGNVGSLIVFAVGGQDAGFLAREFAPVFTADDMIGLEAREMYMKLSVDGRVTKPFSARTLTTPDTRFDNIADITAHTQSTFGENRIIVTREIEKWINAANTSNIVDTSKTEEFPEPIL